MSKNAVRNPIQLGLPNLFSNMWWGLRILWAQSKGVLVGMIALQLIQGGIPAIQALATRNLVNALVDTVGGTDNSAIFFFWLLVNLGSILVNVIAAAADQYLSRVLQDDSMVKVSIQILEHANRLDYAYFEDRHFQDVLERARNNMGGHLSNFVRNILVIGRIIIQLVSLLVILFFIEPLTIPLLALLIAPYIFAYAWLAIARYSKDFNRTTQRRWMAYFLTFFTTHNSVAEIKLFDLTALLQGRFTELLTSFRDQDRQLHRREMVSDIVFGSFTIFLFLFLIIRVALNTIAGAITIGDFTIYVAGTGNSRNMLSKIIQMATRILEEALFINDLREFLSVDPTYGTTRSKPASVTVSRRGEQGDNNWEQLPKITKGEIKIENLSFSYPGTTTNVLHDLSLHIQPGQTVAMVGANGAGKSTLVKLLGRLYTPNEGRILIDGIDIQDLPQPYLYRYLSFLLQAPNKYEASVIENIMYGNWHELKDKPEVIQQIAQQLGMDDMIMNMPDGYDTMLGRRFGDYDLSGGQWKKISAARVFTRDVPVLILDEPTSNMDVTSEYRLFLRFKELTENRTTIIISHRFSTVRIADHIFVLKNGQIIENGSHEELMVVNGEYASLYKMQEQQLLRRYGIDSITELETIGNPQA